MTDYTPETDEVREKYRIATRLLVTRSHDFRAEFNRWLSVVRAETLRAVAEEVRIRGDVGDPDGPTVEDFLNGWADQLQGEYADIREESIQDLLQRREARS